MWILLLILSIRVISALNPKCSMGRFGDGCRLNCHCTLTENCAVRGGRCSSGCATGWSGGSCQRLNMALKKPTWQSSSLYSLTSATLAVDGSTSAVHPHCAHTGWETRARWRVDLRSNRDVYHVTIVGRQDCCASRLQGFHVYVSNTTSNLGSLCYKHPLTSPPPVTNITCGRPIKGRYLIIKNTNSEPLALCEVDVYKCADFTYGPGCTSVCNCRNTMEICERISGTCRTGCAAGWKGDNCTTPCADGTYGDRCAATCRCHNVSEVCDRGSGRCVSGCSPGRSGTACQHECPNWRFGRDCVGHCRCAIATEVCNKTSGECVSGCAAGRMGHDCQIPCKVGYFGSNCANRCHCRELGDVCKKASGHCLSGCSAGWSGRACSQPCAPGRYGIDCMKTCNCVWAEERCDAVTGRCESGCALGWMGLDCKECADGYFGLTCSLRCNCLSKNESCGKTNGTCRTGCQPGYQGLNCLIPLIPAGHQTPTVEGDMTSEVVSGMGGGLAALGTLLLIATVLFINLRRRRRTKRHSIDENGNDTEANSHYQAENREARDLHVAHAYEEVEMCDDKSRDQKFAVKSSNISVLCLRDYVNKCIEEPAILDAQFQNLPSPQKTGYDAASKVENVKKNRYKRILPYDEHRVILNISNNEATTDYINASFIHGHNKEKAYIASQGPTEAMTGDFWLMVWQQHTGKIVMLTGLIEAGRKKCDAYWPEDGEQLQAGCITVEHLATEVYAHYHIRTFKLSKDESIRTVKQFHLMTWSDHEAPSDTMVLLAFREKIHDTNVETDGPVLVHCSAGVGRSGTFIALDILINQSEQTGSVNFETCVTNMRKQRMSMIQTKSQFDFLHRAVSDAYTYTTTPTSVPEFCQSYRKWVTGEQDAPTSIERDFETVSNAWFDEDASQYICALSKANIDKNRSIDILAGDENRVFLSSNVKGCTDYINAIFLPSFTRRNAMIATQLPSQDTLLDFWRLVHEQKPPCIVMLDSVGTDSGGDRGEEETYKESCVEYWPAIGEELTTGPYVITTDSETESDVIKTRVLSVCCNGDEEDTHQMTQLCLLGWDSGDAIPDSPRSLLSVIDAVNNTYIHHDSPIIIQCRDGADRCGVYAAVTALMERIPTEQQVNVLQTVRQIKASRRQFITSLAQYGFLYDALNAHLVPEPTIDHNESTEEDIEVKADDVSEQHVEE